MKNGIHHIETLQQCNCQFSKSTLHPLINVVDLSDNELNKIDKKQITYYAIIFKESNCNSCKYGHLSSDFSDGLLSFYAPGDTLCIKDQSTSKEFNSKILLFHPELLCGTSLELSIESYTFFAYSVDEALHTSRRENLIIEELINNIKNELEHPIDQHSQKIYSQYIELLLEYCSRFYERQFIMRDQSSKRFIKKFIKLIDLYFEKKDRQTLQILTVENCAKQFNMSSAYFEDLLCHETGFKFDEYIQLKRFEIAKKWLLTTNKSVEYIVKELEYEDSQRFCLLFEKMIGCSPLDFRNKN